MATRGWKSHDTLINAKCDLLASGFIFETVMGHRPNKASWYAVTWRALDKMAGYDAGTVEGFKRGAYQHERPDIGALAGPARGTGNGASFSPPAGTMKPVIGPPAGHHLENHLSCFVLFCFAASACCGLSAKPPAANSAPGDLDVVQRWVAGGNSSNKQKSINGNIATTTDEVVIPRARLSLRWTLTTRCTSTTTSATRRQRQPPPGRLRIPLLDRPGAQSGNLVTVTKRKSSCKTPRRPTWAARQSWRFP
jgi:hypothetical protein